jgi:DNA repair protein RadA/Sms
MARVVHRFACRSCGSSFPKWHGRCPDCGTWDALDELRTEASAAVDKPLLRLGGAADAAAVAMPLAEVDPHDRVGQRLSTGIGELDRVLGGPTEAEPQRSGLTSGGGGGGLVPGSAVLVGGDPGIGKSTLMLQAAERLARSGATVLYVSSEESAAQVRLRAERLTTQRPLPASLLVLADTNVARVMEQARKAEPDVVVIDSIQMLYQGDLPAAPGSVSQLRACTLALVHYARNANAALLLVGHVTKEGAIAGPKLLEHMVDTVLYFEGDRYHQHRVVRAIKNRFGNTMEVGLFEMTGGGLMEVQPGVSLLGAATSPRAGSVVCPVLTGSRCLLVELQALTSTGFLGSVKRKVSGLDGSRLAMLIAVLEKHGGLRLADQDVFTSSVGGMKVAEPAADLALALAIAGTFLNRSLPAGVAAAGELGLGGEVRHVQQFDRRAAEAGRLGFHTLIAPHGSKPPAGTAKVVPVRTLGEALGQLH